MKHLKVDLFLAFRFRITFWATFFNVSVIFRTLIFFSTVFILENIQFFSFLSLEKFSQLYRDYTRNSCTPNIFDEVVLVYNIGNSNVEIDKICRFQNCIFFPVEFFKLIFFFSKFLIFETFAVRRRKKHILRTKNRSWVLLSYINHIEQIFTNAPTRDRDS